MSAKHFKNLVGKGYPVGEVVGVNRYIITVSGIAESPINALIMFEDGSKGVVYQVLADRVIVLHLGDRTLEVGTAAVMQHDDLVSRVGKDFIGRVVSVFGDPLDGKGAITPDGVWPVFNPAPPLIKRQQLDTQFETGVTMIDALFPLSYGQRMAILGDSKSGKTTMATQVAINQRQTEKVTIYVLIGKRRADVNMLLNRLSDNNALENTIVIVSTMFDSLVTTYLAPYVAVSMAEYLWQVENKDCLIIYDDLTSHAYAYREISLLAQVSPGRDSFPGDMFYAHSSLLERAGRLRATGRTLTSLPLVLVPGGDITTYLPTNIMSITDGQFILDMDLFRNGQRPAVSTGLSVSRVGGVGHNKRQKEQNAEVTVSLSRYREAEEFSHFGAEIGKEAQRDLTRGEMLNEMLTQLPGESFSLMAQQLMIDIVLTADETKIDMVKMKGEVNAVAQAVTTDETFDPAKQKLLSMVTLEGGPQAAPTPAEGQPQEAAQQTAAPEQTPAEPAAPEAQAASAEQAAAPAAQPVDPQAGAQPVEPAQPEENGDKK